MELSNGRYPVTQIAVAVGWSLERLAPASRLYGANGLRTGPDGRIYIAQVAGSQISALDPNTGSIEVISPMGGDIVGPDDLVFDDDGNLYATEITEGRVSVRTPGGSTRVLLGDMPVANPITYHNGHLIAGECRPGARIMELDRNGGAPRVILDDVPMVNAFEVGPDGKLYFPVMGTNEIWRISLSGGEPEVVAGDLGVPDSVKFDRHGFIISTQVASGQVLRIDPRTGQRSVVADIGSGLDNCTFVGDRLFVSHISGAIHEVLAPGQTRQVVQKGFQWPMGLAVGDDETLYVADGGFSYTLRPGEELQLAGTLFTPDSGYPGFTRGVAPAGPGKWLVTTANGEIRRYSPSNASSDELVAGFEELMGVAPMPGGGVAFAEAGTGRLLAWANGEVSVLATGLEQPMGVAVAPDGVCYVAESGRGRVLEASGGQSEVVVDGLMQPEGLALHGGRLFILDVGSKQLIELDLESGSRHAIASHLPVGAPPGAVRKYLGGIGVLSGPMMAFAGVAAGSDGTLYLSADGEGSVMAVQPLRR